jgi:signal transduction histidine kinase
MESTLTQEELRERLLGLYGATLGLVQDTSLDSLLTRIAKTAQEVANARYAALGVLDESGELVQFIPVGMSEEEIQRVGRWPQGRGLIGALMRGGQPIRVADIAQDPRSAGFPPNHPPMTSFLGVPIRQGDEVLGQIYLTDKRGGQEFGDDDQRIIEMLAAYAAAAINNARLVRKLVENGEKLRRHNENLALLNELATMLATSTDLDTILSTSLREVITYLHLDVGEAYLRQEESKRLVLVCHVGDLVPTLWPSTAYTLGEGPVGIIARNERPSVLAIGREDGHQVGKEVTESALQQIYCFPLNAQRGPLGVAFFATTSAEPLDEADAQFLRAFCSWLSTAVENVRLNMQSRRLAVLEERERIGMDLHDGIIQSIYGVGLMLDQARALLNEDGAKAYERIDQAITTLDETIRDIRTYILDLRPRHLRDETLEEGIERLVREFRANTLVEVNLQLPKEPLAGLGGAQTNALFHICQEALANVAKHAAATHVDVILWRTPERALLEVRDNGSGYDQRKARQTIGHGLSNMQIRAHSADGDVEITSEAAQGTSVLAWVPFPQAAGA